jgi:metal-responsive CopG/Arc/MetJ family transcriptional regulator
MAKVISIKRGRGRAPIQISAVRLTGELAVAIDRWAEKEKVRSRSEAIRHLVELALASARPAGRRDPQSVSKASDMATEQVKKMINPLLSEEEKRTRRRTLIRGPREFREMRGDQTKPKK